MKRLLLPLASLRLTLVGMLLLAIGAALSYNNPATTPVWVLVVPMALLAVNLLAAIITNPRINRRGGLLTFHLALLGVVILAAIGRLTHLEAHIELLQDTAFSSKDIFDDSRGPLHRGKLDEISFVQGPYTVDYAAGMMRGLTHSQVRLPAGQGGWETRVLGGAKTTGLLVVNTGEQRLELIPGEAAKLPGGQLRYERLSTWMGYKIFYDPTLQALFIVAMSGVLGMAAHFWQKFGARWPGMATATSAPDSYSHSPKGVRL